MARGMAAGAGFDVDAMANVQTEAIDFMLPRSLEAVTAGQLAMWALGGLTSIDPALTAVVQNSDVELLVRGRTVLHLTVPTVEAASVVHGRREDRRRGTCRLARHAAD